MSNVNFAKALADETRQKIMSLCCCKQLSVTEIVQQMGVSQPTVSHHLKILRDAGLVKVERRGKEIYYTLNQERLATACCQIAEVFAPDVEIKLGSS
ncbi:MAG: putative ArsR family transcriptional regulator [Chloroflexi bacterium]|nr:MAG: putative ArsR family transcriptional regulator [Chloroflexota bacterium]MBA4374889.1 transcriptional regulator [Anaerolinea sp.]